MEGYKLYAKVTSLVWLYLAWISLTPIVLVRLPFVAAEVAIAVGLIFKPTRQVLNWCLAGAGLFFVFSLPAITNSAIANYAVLWPTLIAIILTLATWGRARQEGVTGRPIQRREEGPPPDLI